jgi:hypothetical protein
LSNYSSSHSNLQSDQVLYNSPGMKPGHRQLEKRGLRVYQNSLPLGHHTAKMIVIEVIAAIFSTYSARVSYFLKLSKTVT